MKTLIIATTNPGKMEWYGYFMSKYKNDINLLSLGDFSVTSVVDEPLGTAEENARYKAKEYSSRFDGKDVLATDIGLYVDFLPPGQQPGVHPRRLKDKNIRMTDQEIYDYWLERLSRLEGRHGGYWHNAFCIWTKDGKIIEDTFDRRFIFCPEKAVKYQPGLPMGGLCCHPKTGKMHAEMNKEDILLMYSDLQLVFDRMMDQYLSILLYTFFIIVYTSVYNYPLKKIAVLALWLHAPQSSDVLNVS